MTDIILSPGISLLHQHLVRNRRVPGLCFPGVVRPAQTEREIRSTGVDDFRKNPVQEPPSGKPVVPIAETFNPGFAGHACLLFPHLGHAQVVITEVGRDTRLIMAGEEGFRPSDIGPLREPFSPPFVIFRGGIKLWQIKGNCAGHYCLGLEKKWASWFVINLSLYRNGEYMLKRSSASLNHRTGFSMTGIPFASTHTFRSRSAM